MQASSPCALQSFVESEAAHSVREIMPNPEIKTPQTQASESSERTVRINPLLYQGWDSLLAAHPGSSFFHMTAWARVLHETYGHFPIYFSRFVDGRLEELLPIMEITSPFTGCRGVSLPFTDVCSALQTTLHPRALHQLAIEHSRRRNWHSLECRSNDSEWPGASPSLNYYGHAIDLRQGKRHSSRVSVVPCAVGFARRRGGEYVSNLAIVSTRLELFTRCTA
jgi:hypothetical protein